MTRSKRMQPVVRVAEDRERRAAQALGDAQRRLAENEGKLVELIGYREQYAQGFNTAGGVGLDARRLHEYRVFLERLGTAISQQSEVVEQLRRDCEHVRRRWLETRTHAQALDKVTERYRQAERKAQERLEQHDSDERALRAHRKPSRED
ncbi:MAG TPA: flagellar export protein FliJ [Gammaproteobacteria bacterium]|nr:flagellar export protein FliJ [Gammaproteobacteria bacterium]